MIALLNGDSTQNIISFETQYQQRRLKCTDKEVLKYFKEILSKPSENPGPNSAVSYMGYFTFEGGVVFKTYIGINGKVFTISIPSQAAEESFPTHTILLTEPIPEKVRQIFEFLDEPYQKVAGTVLIIEDGKPAYTKHDASLVVK